MTEYVPLFSLRSPLQQLPGDQVKEQRPNSRGSQKSNGDATPVKLPRLSDKNANIITTSKGQGVYAEGMKKSFLNRSSLRRKSIEIVKAEMQPRKSLIISQRPRSRGLNDSKVGENPIVRPKTPITIKRKDSLKTPGEKIDQWIDMTDKRSKIYDNMMKQHQLENRIKLGDKSKDLGKSKRIKGKVINNQELNASNIIAKDIITLEEKLDQDINEILSDQNFYPLKEKVPESCCRPDLYLKEFDKMNQRRKKEKIKSYF